MYRKGVQGDFSSRGEHILGVAVVPGMGRVRAGEAKGMGGELVEREAAAALEDAGALGEGPRRVEIAKHAVGGDDRVEAFGGEGERMGKDARTTGAAARTNGRPGHLDMITFSERSAAGPEARVPAQGGQLARMASATRR